MDSPGFDRMEHTAQDSRSLENAALAAVAAAPGPADRSRFARDMFYTIALDPDAPPLFTAQADRLRFAVARVQADWPVEPLGWVVLPRRMHAIWRLPDPAFDDLARWRAVERSFRAVLRDQGECQDGFQENVQGDRQDAALWTSPATRQRIVGAQSLKNCLAFCRYAPVIAGLVRAPDLWPYSSFTQDRPGPAQAA